ncbi:MAG: nitroreductase family protein [Candidatus Aminicenantes bacterium]|jgi:nitroreductase
MDVSQTIRERRAYRSLAPVEVTEDLVKDLAEHVRLAPSCFNNQPWRFVFVYHPDALKEMFAALSAGNSWARESSMIIAAFSKEDDDCVIRDRLYHQFDMGLAVGFLVLRATELGFVAHPIAGFSPKKTREILGIPEEYKVITLIIVGKHAESISPALSEGQIEAEKHRPQRKPLDEFVFTNKYSDL